MENKSVGNENKILNKYFWKGGLGILDIGTQLDYIKTTWI